jgi:DNA-binding GntR family transcriptional regulator
MELLARRREDVMDDSRNETEGNVSAAGAAITPARSWREVVDLIAAAIGKGEWQPGQELPTHAALARRYARGPDSVRHAIEVLGARGLVIPQGPGRSALIAGAGITPPRSWAEVADLIAAAIDRGEWRPGQRLPTHAALARRYATNPRIVPHAIKALAALGLVISQGRGRPALVPRAETSG